MNVLLSPQPPLLPHQHESPRQSPSRSLPPFAGMIASRKRKAEEDAGDEMNMSPTTSPAISLRQLSRPAAKKARAAEMIGRPLPLPRLLEALDADQLRTILQTICNHRPEIAQQVSHSAPRPSAASTLELLGEYQERLRSAIPYGNSSADYNYYRVKQPLFALVDAISEFTRQFLPPVETQLSNSLTFLDGATKIIHQLPEWDNPTHRQHKEGAYDEIARAWALVIQEASKRNAGFNSLFLTERWDHALSKHNQQAGGRLAVAMNAASTHFGFGANEDSNSIRNQLMNGTYGSPVRVGPW